MRVFSAFTGSGQESLAVKVPWTRSGPDEEKILGAVLSSFVLPLTAVLPFNAEHMRGAPHASPNLQLERKSSLSAVLENLINLQDLVIMQKL